MVSQDAVLVTLLIELVVLVLVADVKEMYVDFAGFCGRFRFNAGIEDGAVAVDVAEAAYVLRFNFFGDFGICWVEEEAGEELLVFVAVAYLSGDVPVLPGLTKCGGFGGANGLILILSCSALSLYIKSLIVESKFLSCSSVRTNPFLVLDWPWYFSFLSACVCVCVCV
ncbi:hypothetical protein WICPIJ_001446 [Wickerhamomyces pijperi]|uniref:Uncharacterized protein n=1 Tax=Wickerhamomyces pijperi TaxID=599730 RepID=A0A9P8QBN2_WICPI|nr:hypothetical protein WICPIJ_001446 [Wickerhamomyces pijperi]